MTILAIKTSRLAEWTFSRQTANTDCLMHLQQRNTYIFSVTECGGMIHANIGKIIYKPDEKYGNSERCAWIIRSPYFNNTLYMTKTRSGFELGKDYLSVHGFDTSDSESTTIGRTTNDIESRTMRRTVAVVVFTSDAGGEDGTGFELEFKFNGTALYGVETYFDSFSSEVSGLVKVGGAEPGDNYGRLVIIVKKPFFGKNYEF